MLKLFFSIKNKGIFIKFFFCWIGCFVFFGGLFFKEMVILRGGFWNLSIMGFVEGVIVFSFSEEWYD